MSSSSSRSSYRNPRPGPNKIPKIQLKIKCCRQPGAGNKTAKTPMSPRKAGRHRPHPVGPVMAVAVNPGCQVREKSGWLYPTIQIPSGTVRSTGG